ncbi:PQQ-binding-like beta-propeller repeat protein [Verrucomicrobiota bacterium]
MKKILALCVVVHLVSGFARADVLLRQGYGGQAGKDIVKVSGVKGGHARIVTQSVSGGLVVCIGAENPEFVAGLRADEKYLVHCLDVDQKNVDKARKYIQEKGLYGKVSVNVFDGNNLPYADNLVNLIVVNSAIRVPHSEIERVLVPRGVAVIKEEGNKDLISRISYPVSRIRNGFVKITKPVPPSIDEWTHWTHAADGNMVSKDQLVGPPRHVQWAVGPMWQRHHGMIPSFWGAVTSSGRIFYIADEAPMGVSGIPGIWRLIARDAFNGKLLWKRDIPKWGPTTWGYYTASHGMRFHHPINIRKRMIVVGDRLYVTLAFDSSVSALDAGTGEILKTYEGTEYADEIVMHKGVLYVSANDRPLMPWPGKGTALMPTERQELARKTVVALDPESGKKLWESKPFAGISAGRGRMEPQSHLNLTVSDQGVFVVVEKGIFCLEPETGTVRWTSPRLFMLDPKIMGAHFYNVNMHSVVCYEGVCFVSHPHQTGKEADLQALSPETGEELWRYTCGPSGFSDGPNLFGINGLIWVVAYVEGEPPKGRKYHIDPREYLGLDPKTGAVKDRLSVQAVFEDVPHHHRCYPDKATENYMILGRRGAEFVNMDGSGISFHHWARNGCRQGPTLANGLFYRFPDSCRCFIGYQPRGFYAFASEASVGLFKERLTEENPLIKGPCYAEATQGKPAYAGREAGLVKSEAKEDNQKRDTHHASRITQKDWPTFRHDPMRSSTTPASVPGELKVAWKKKFGSNVSPPVIADGIVYLSRIDEHQIVALDAVSGAEKWTHIAGAKVDSPPTIYGNLLLYGARNGWVHCLRASDGELVWRFRAAPGDRLIMAYDQLESSWPVSGSVLVEDGKAVFTAGHSALLDGGLYIYVLDVETGKLIEKKKYSLEQKDSISKVNSDGAFSGILALGDKGVMIREKVFRLDTSLKTGSSPDKSGRDKIPAMETLSGFHDSQWFYRTRWIAGEATGVLLACDVDASYYVKANNYRGNTSFFFPKGSSDAGVAGGSVKNGKHSDSKYDGVALGRAEGKKKVWEHETFLVCPWSMVVTEKNLFVAGFSLEIDNADPWAAFEGRKGGILTVMDKETGKKISEYKLDSPPVWNGMAAVEGKLFISCMDGSIVCFGE